jgi:uncharacterized protein
MSTQNPYLLLEFLILFWITPPILAYLKPHGFIYITLWISTFLAWLWMRRHGYSLKEDWNHRVIGKVSLTVIFLQLSLISLALFIFTAVMIPERLFSLPLQRPTVWVMVLILYPILSVIPQEILFRSFFFKRYKELFSTQTGLIIASAASFGWVHIILQNWVAVVFSFFGGLIFARTYAKTNSLAATCAEHAIYGCVIFTLGLGYYFYHGAVR